MFNFIKRWLRKRELRRQEKDLEAMERERFFYCNGTWRTHQGLVLQLWETDFQLGTIVENHTLGYGEKSREVIDRTRIVEDSEGNYLEVRDLLGEEYRLKKITRIDEREGVFYIETEKPIRSYAVAPKYVGIPKTKGKNIPRENGKR
jgi:hypothetical protein